MLNLLLTVSVSFVITILAIPAIIRVARDKKLYDLPDARKLHTKPIASLGGVGIFIGFLITSLLCISSADHSEIRYFFAAAVVIFFLGVKDDILILSARKKFLGQLAAAAIIIHLGNIRIDSMHGLLGLYQVPDAVGLVLSYTTIIVVVNAFNLIDGVDGLAASLGIISTAIFGAYFFFAGMEAYSLMAFAMASSLGAFLVYNYHPARIFMGDSGSLLLGLVNSILVIKFITAADSPASQLPLGSAAALGFSILIVPLLDTLRVFSIRIAKGRSPFAPDRNHIHHLLLDRGFNHKYVTLSCAGLNISFIAMAYFGRSFGPSVLIATMVATFYALVGALMLLKKPASTLVIAKSFQHNAEPLVQPATKVVSMKPDAVVAD
jgi:UDP-GlcNAc:undecaprenyl-phosphate GlcNAc-1-phosphate transferase